MVDIDPAEWSRQKPKDDNWELVKEAYPEFVVVKVPLKDSVTIREAANILAGLAQQLLANTNGPCPDQHATISKCHTLVKVYNARIKNRPARMKTRDYVYGPRDENNRVVNIRKSK